MKKFFFLIICSLLILQNISAQVGYAPEAGINFSNMKFAPPFPFQSVSTNWLTGPRIGGVVDLDMGPHTYIQPGAFFSSKGAKRNTSYNFGDTVSENVKETLRLNYIEVPINVLYKTGLQGDPRFFFGLGVNLAQTVGGQDKVLDAVDTGTGKIFNVNTNSKVKGLYAGFDVGLNFTLGYELPMGLYIRAYYTLGVTDISLNTDNGETDKNYVAGISAGYFFGKNRHHKRVVPPVEE